MPRLDELHGFTRSVGTMEREDRRPRLRLVRWGSPSSFVHDSDGRRRRRRARRRDERARPRREAVVARRPRPQRPLSATLPGGLGLAVAQRPGRRPARARAQPAPGADVDPRRRPAGGARARRAGRAPTRTHAAARRLRPRPDGATRSAGGSARARRAGSLRRAAGARARLHAGLRPLQQRPPHLRERALARRPARGPGRGVAGRGRPRSRSSGTRWAGSSRAAPATSRRQDGARLGPARRAT